MALNVTTAVFRPGFNIATASPSLVQWDQGQTLQFEGVELPSAYQVEFTNAVTVQAITMIGNENGVEIPNELLQQSFPINAYIVLHETAEDRETEYWATIYVKARQKPREETPDPEQSSVIDQTIAALQEGVAEAQAASQAVQNMGVEAETLPEGSEATVEKTVDPETGEVTLEFGIPEGRHGATGATPDIQIGTVTTGAPGSQADASITGTREEPRLNLTIPQGPQGDAGVTSVNGKTGAVTLDASDVGAKPASYEAPVSSVNGKTGAVVLGASDVGAKPASYEAPVSSVNGKTGAVVLSASDVGAKPASYEAPVSSVNEKTGAVVLDSEDIRYDSTETYSDGTVGKELGTINSALSSLSSVTEIIDTASGAIASFPDGSGLPMRSLVAEINPVQDLHGYANPWPAGGGVNKLNTDRTAGTPVPTDNRNDIPRVMDTVHYFAGMTRNNYYAADKVSNVSISGTEISFSISSGGYGIAFPIEGKADTDYTVSFTDVSNGKVSVGFYNADWEFIQDRDGTPSPYTTHTPANCAYISVIVTGQDIGAAQVKNIQIEEGSTAPTAWSPYSNICPISGWQGLSGQRTGKNLLNIDRTSGEPVPTDISNTTSPRVFDTSKYYEGARSDNYYYKPYITASIAAGIVSLTLTSGNNSYGVGIPVSVIGGETYTFSAISTNGMASFGYYDASWNYIGTSETVDIDAFGKATVTIPSNAKYILVVLRTNVVGNTGTFRNCQLELGSTATSYEPYQGNQISVNFGQTVYGGTDEVVSGNGTVTYALDVIDGTQELSNNGILPYGGIQVVYSPSQSKAYAVVSSFEDLKSNLFTASDDGTKAYQVNGRKVNGNIYFNMPSTVTTVDEAKAWFASNPTQVWYKLATPQTFTHEGQQIDTLYGQNNVWVDTGDVSVTYQASIKGYIDKVLGA